MFELRVEFAGLCLYLIHPDKTRVAILMPGAQKAVNRVHADDELGEPHVGYLRFDLANLNVNGATGIEPGSPNADSGQPPYEVVHLLNREELDFGLARVPTPMQESMTLPELEKYADSVTIIPDLFHETKPPDELLMRTIISGGSLDATSKSGKTWVLGSTLRSAAHPGGNPHAGAFAGFALWKRDVDAAGLTITLRKFKGGTTTIPLKPVTVNGKDVIALKVANLCAHNPLEWDELPIRTVENHDVDFKWFYRLLTPKQGDWATALAGAELPFPRLRANTAFGDEDCTGQMTRTIAFP